MRRDAWILVGTVTLGAIAQWGSTIPEALTRMKTFRVTDVEVRGTRFLSSDAVIAELGVTDQTSVWTDTDVWTERLLAHPLVDTVSITRRVPSGLLVQVVERRPIALAPTPTLEPVDAEGRRLPVDPAAHRLDLPVIVSDRTPPSASTVFPEDVRRLAAELDHLINADTAFHQRVSSVRWGERGTVIVRWTEPPVEFLLPPRASPTRLREGLGALSDAMSRTPAERPSTIDLRFSEQVVVRRGGR